LAVFGKKVKCLKSASMKGIVPNKGLRLFEKLASAGGEEVVLSLEKNQLFFRTEGVQASTLLIEGTYPDYKRVIPKENDKILDIATADLVAGLRQASILAGEETKAVRFHMEKDKLILLAESVGAGEAKVEIPAIYGSDTLELQFNPIFFLDFLRHVDQERVDIKFRDTETAAMVQIGQEYTYVIMPLVTH
jgi:DNA polymerase-3 subunit beta